MLNLIIIMGAGEKREGQWLGLRDFSKKMEEKYEVSTRMFQHDDGDISEVISQMTSPLVGVGHSFGGYELYHAKRVWTSCDSMLLLDPKPKPFFQWWNPFYTFPLPKAYWYRDYWGGFGRPFIGGYHSLKLDLNHEDFPSDSIVQLYIESEIIRLSQGVV